MEIIYFWTQGRNSRQMLEQIGLAPHSKAPRPWRQVLLAKPKGWALIPKACICRIKLKNSSPMHVKVRLDASVIFNCIRLLRMEADNS